MASATDISSPRYRAVGYAYEQARALGIDWRFPCNPDMDDLCDRAELAGMLPVVIFAPIEDACAVFDGEASVMIDRR